MCFKNPDGVMALPNQPEFITHTESYFWSIARIFLILELRLST